MNPLFSDWFKFTLLIGLAWGVSCQQEQEPIPLRNDFYAQNNDIVFDQSRIGEKNGRYSLWQIEPAGEGFVYFRGYSDPDHEFSLSSELTDQVLISVGQNGEVIGDSINEDWILEYIVGKIAIDGRLFWSRSTGFANRCITTVDDGTGQWANALVSVGMKGDSCYGQIISEGGNLIAHYAYGLPSTQIFLNSVIYRGKKGAEFEFIFAGAALEKMNQVAYPIIIRGFIDENSLYLNIDQVEILHSYPNKYIVNTVESDNGTLFISLDDDGRVIENTSIYLARLDDLLQPTWIQEIQGDIYEIDHSLQSLAWSDGQLFVAGSTDDQHKQHGRTTYRRSGKVISYSEAGSFLWESKIVASKWNEELFSIQVDENQLYVGGIQGDVYYSTSRETFGNGLIAILDKVTGSVVNGYTINDIFDDPDQAYRAEIRTLCLIDDELIFGGQYNKEHTYSSYYGWFGKIKRKDL